MCGNLRPDPAKCPVPELLSENETVWELFQLVRNQFIVAPMGGVIGINLVAILGVVDLYSPYLEDKIEIFERLVYLSHLETARIQDKTNDTPKAEDPKSDGQFRPRR